MKNDVGEFDVQLGALRTRVRVQQVLRSEADDGAVADLIRQCVGAKKVGHGIDSPDFLRPQRAMYQIGG